MTTNQLINKIVTEGGALVSSNDCSEMEIADAQDTGRFSTNDDGMGFVLRSKEWLALQMAREKAHPNSPFGYASSILAEISAEVERATKKFPTWPTDPIHANAVVQEEAGELTKEVLQLTYEPHKSSKEAVRTEAVQLAAMAIRFMMSLDRYAYEPRPQHSQQNVKSAATGSERNDHE